MERLIGEIRMFAGSYAPEGWALCEGQELKIEEHVALFAVIGVRYGGNGRSTFALPDFRGRGPVHPSAELDGESGALSAGNGEDASAVPGFLCVNFLIALQGIFPSRG